MTLRIVRGGIRQVIRAIKVSVAFGLFMFLIQRSTYPLWINWNAVSVIVRDHQFDYLSWELKALGMKAAQVLWGSQGYIEEASRSDFVRAYMADLQSAQQLEAQIQAIYIDPAINDPQAASETLRAERDFLRSDLNKRQSLAESILEGQVAAVLVDEGFGTMGQLMPPISMHFTRMPNLLVVSPRNEIKREIELVLDPLALEQIVDVEGRIGAELDLSALVVPLGGMALYPAMIQESASIHWTVETFAHEWVHHYLFFFPLGLSYFTSSAGGREATIINETAADTFGKEVREIVLRRYYPELAAQTTDIQTVTVSFEAQADAPFDFGRTMHVTRVVVDKMMAEIAVYENKLVWLQEPRWIEFFDSRIDTIISASEIWMEQRRILFFENGYRIRKLNQAYFAFYGGYQAGDRPGVGGDDPIGPAVQEIRAMSSSLHEFIVTMRGISTREQLLVVRDQMQTERGTALNRQTPIP